MTLRIAIVSDLHCHHSNAGHSDTLLLSDLARRPEKQHPVSALDLLIKNENLEADVLLLPGDFTSRADQQGMNSAWDYATAIKHSLKARITASTIGNHDVIWTTPADDAFNLARNLLPLFPTENTANHHSFWSEGFYFEEQSDYRILVLNTVKHYTNEVSAKRGLVSQGQLNSIERYLRSASPKPFQIGLCHHHPIQHEEIALGSTDLMENGTALVELLSRYSFNILVHGHKHHPRLRIDSSGGHSLAVFASGSFSACMSAGLGSRVRNAFHIVHLFPDEDNLPLRRGTIVTWQFQQDMGWTKATQSAADFPHLTGFGATETPDYYARKIHDTFRAHGSDIVRWTLIAGTIPDLEWVPPMTFRSIGQILQHKGLQLVPEAPDRPIHIGTPT